MENESIITDIYTTAKMIRNVWMIIVLKFVFKVFVIEEYLVMDLLC